MSKPTTPGEWLETLPKMTKSHKVFFAIVAHAYEKKSGKEAYNGSRPMREFVEFIKNRGVWFTLW